SVVWGKQFDGDGTEQIIDAVVDSAGNLVLAGTFTGSLNFSPGQLGATITANGTGYQTDGFIAVLGSDGAFKWGKAIGAIGSHSDKVTGITCDGDNNLYVHGYFTNGTVDFGS